MSPTKRLFDVTASLLGLAVLSPVLAAIAVAVRRDGGPVFFRQQRIGRGGAVFRIWKFRTMVVDADRMGSLVTVGGDPRITAVGRFLRRHKLDELPQLLNVVLGEMSLVGPRPEVERYVRLYTPAQRRVLELTPGITDPASIAFRDEERILAGAADPERFYIDEVMPAKIRVNLAYAARATLARDVGVILTTFGVILPTARSVTPTAAQRSA